MKPMSDTQRRREKMQRYRANRKARGFQHFSAMLSGNALNRLDQIRDEHGLTSREKALESHLTGELSPTPKRRQTTKEG